MMREMLKKGDAIRPKYEGFDFSQLDSTQIAWLERLSKFTKFRGRVESYFQEVKMSNEMKLLFIEQHSMKLGDRVFYEIESARQQWLQAWYAVPYVGPAIGLVFLCGFAYRVPIQ